MRQNRCRLVSFPTKRSGKADCRTDIGLRKIVTDEQQRQIALLGQRIGEAISEIETGRMKALAPLAVDGTYLLRDFLRDRNNLRLDPRQKLVKPFENTPPAGHDIHFRQGPRRYKNVA